MTPARAISWVQTFSIVHLTRRLTRSGDRLAADGPMAAAGIVFGCDVGAAAVTDAGTHVRTDALADLLEYEPWRDGPSRQAFVADALDRIEAGQRLCTITGLRRPTLYAWLTERPSTEAAAAMLPGVRLPEGAAIAEVGASQPPLPAKDWARAMAAIMRDAAARGTTRVYVLSPSHRPELHAAAASLGFARVAAHAHAATASATG